MSKFIRNITPNFNHKTWYEVSLNRFVSSEEQIALLYQIEEIVQDYFTCERDEKYVLVFRFKNEEDAVYFRLLWS
jgi:hypothetical protein